MASGGPKIIIAGAPASGKGTQCELIRQKFGVVHLSTGDMLRDAAAKGTEVGLLAKQYMEQGKLVPDEMIIGAVKERLAQADCQEKGWLLDGFPRTGAQAEALQQAGIVPDVFVFLNVPDEDLIERVVGRRADPETGKIYHLKFSPPETEEIAARLTQRADDTEEKVKVRLQSFHQHLSAITGKYESIKMEVDGNNTKNKGQIFEEVSKGISARLEGASAQPRKGLSVTALPASKGPKIIIAGGPASGKGTQCELIKEKFGVVHLSTGDMLRDAAAKGTEVGLLAKQYMEQGKLVPDEMIIGAVKERLAQADCQERGWLLDGFPRTGAQAEALQQAGIVSDVFVFLNVPDEDLIERVVGRRADPETGKIYHLKFSPPETEEIAARLTQRADDTEKKVKVRVQAFHQHLSSIMGKYEAIKVEVDGNNTKNKAQIFNEVTKGIRTRLDGASAQPRRQPSVKALATSKGPKIIIAGAPASGKGTQCELIREKFGVVHLSTGDMLRDAAVKGTEVGLLAKQYMEQGKLVPDEMIIGAVKERLTQADCQERGWLLDGFPRTGAQAEALQQAGIVPDVFVFLNVPDEDLIERVVGRRADPETGKIYHLKFSPPETEEIAARLTQRADDTEEKVKVRVQAFHQHLSSIMGKYEAIKVEVDGNNTKNKAQIFDEVNKGIMARLPHASRDVPPLVRAPSRRKSSLKVVPPSKGPKIIIAGAPASGKGTQCELIKEKFGVVHLSTGDMLRDAAVKATEVGLLAKQYMEQGKLVPDRMIIDAVKERLAQTDCQERGWLLDGFPRTGAQAEALQQAGVTPDVFVFLNVPDEDLVERVVGRRLDPQTGKIYHLKFSPPETGDVAARLTQRADDTEEKVMVRLQAFHHHLQSIMSKYEPVKIEVDGNNSKRKDQIFDAVSNGIGARLHMKNGAAKEEAHAEPKGLPPIAEKGRAPSTKSLAQCSGSSSGAGRPLRIIIAGAPASGKGTQCELIREKFGVVHLSTGDMLRDAAAKGTEVGLLAKQYMEQGKLVPDEIIVSAVKERLEQRDCQEKGWLLDGYPRTGAQAEALKQAGVIPDVFIFLNVPDHELIERVVGRRADPVTGKIYHLKFSPPETDEIRARLTQRADDTEEKVKVRLQAFYQHLESIASYFRPLMFRVDGSQGKHRIFEAISDKLDHLRRYEVVFVLGGPGCGKGTQCKRIVQNYGYVHLSAGDLLRDERASGSALADMINTCIKEGKIVPAEVTINLLRKAMAASGKNRFLIDGFPRNLENFTQWYELAGNETRLSFALFFQCPEEVLQARLLERGKTSGRNDDNIETIKKRFKTFHEDSMPVIQRLNRLGKIRTLSAVPPPDVVFAKVRRVFEGLSLIPLPDRTLAMIKPDAVSHGVASSILQVIDQAGFTIVGQIKRTLTAEEAETFYAEHKGKGFFEKLIAFMTSGPVIALALEREDAVKQWRKVMGPTNSLKAAHEAPESIRGKYGTDGTENAAHGSDSVLSAARELMYWFPDGYGRYKTLAMIKPYTADVHHETIKSIILAHGFDVTAELHTQLTRERACEFYAEHDGKPFFECLVEYMSSDTVVALTLEREGAIKAWRTLAGPTNSDKARQEKSQSIRALYGVDGTMNAVHGSDSIESAQRENSFWFPRPIVKPSGSKMVTAYVGTNKFPEMSSYMNTVVDPVLAPIILKALVQRPPNFVSFCVDELKDVQRVNSAPASSNGRDLPPVKSKSPPITSPAF